MQRRFGQRRRSRSRARQEGAVLLVVMLVLMVATASAAVSVNTVQSEMQAAGHDRMATQTRYVSEVAVMTTLAFIDQIAPRKELERMWLPAPPVMEVYGEPSIPVGVGGADLWMRYSMEQHDALPTALTDVAPVTNTDPNDATVIGSFGPRVTYGVPNPRGYVVDLTDCMVAPAAATAGAPVPGSSGTGSAPVQFYCTLTARGRVTRDADDEEQRDVHERRWTFDGAVYDQGMYDNTHDSRAIILTPSVPMETEQ